MRCFPLPIPTGPGYLKPCTALRSPGLWYLVGITPFLPEPSALEIALAKFCTLLVAWHTVENNNNIVNSTRIRNTPPCVDFSGAPRATVNLWGLGLWLPLCH